MKSRSRFIFALAAAFTCFPSLTMATVLNPGATITMTGTSVAEQPVLAGTVINDDTQETVLNDIYSDGSPFSTISTGLQNRVVRSSSDGTLIFSPRISTIINITFGDFLIDRMELTGFGGFMVDAAYRTDGLGDRGPTTASRSVDGDVMTFNYGFPLIGGNLFADPHDSSYFLSLNTDATAFTLDGSISIFARHINLPGETLRFDFDNVAVPAISSVPVPAAFWLFGSGLLGFVTVAKRKKLK